MASTAAEIICLHWLLGDMGVPVSDLTLTHCDNFSVIQIAPNSVFHERNKHTEIDYHFTRHHFQLGTIAFSLVSDLFTKSHSIPSSTKMITDISSIQVVLLSSQLKEILRSVESNGMHKPIKIFYHPREPFFVFKQPTRITVVFPMRFKEKEDVIIATTFFEMNMVYSLLQIHVRMCEKSMSKVGDLEVKLEVEKGARFSLVKMESPK
ncbi:actin-related protein 2/3 complex subunit 2b [Phtheirospermum japonicum]|uniref:Arp2/3 complex 34 kDa subunit n=1 Tax=Phtheirospermum japonicum TaxID=374723 RepID=A0A830D782_9LAMI|nr:actin-related protein 2/3 complex subunit 2b [Phtheirospermum japonicum]